ncbi:MAG: hypothetical protein LBD11_03455 [Candidatus Peribacteria bacterium]|jgi:uncharacterized membrane protein YqiK|nr:hypothetical protein [Candidatus Peribacteria bacterium]
MEILSVLVSYWWLALLAIFVVVILFKSIVNVQEIATIEQKYFGKEMADGRTVALPGEVGVQAKIFGPGLHLIIPFVQKVKKYRYTVIGANQMGLVKARSGASIPQGNFMARAVECNSFQDGIAFLRNGGQKGQQIAVLPPGEHRINPYLFEVSIQNAIEIQEGEIGLVESIDGETIPTGSIMAKIVECDFFQDPVAFFANGGQKGPQITVIPPGNRRINTYLFKVKIVPEIHIEENKIGLVKSIDGKPIPVGRIMAEAVECNLFQDAKAFLENGGQKGPQLDVLTPGKYRINTYLFNITVADAIRVPDKHICTVTAVDGERIPEGRILAATVEGHSSFEKGSVFLETGGQKGQQSQYLMPGTYRINTNLFKISNPIPWIEIAADEVGIVTTLEGRPLTDKNQIAAQETALEAHSNFQDVQAFLNAGGEKGLQIPVLRAGSYPINPWFASVEKQDMVNVGIGECAVITSFVGSDYTAENEDENNNVNAKLVPSGYKGIWKAPLGPGLHPLNSKICAWNIVPTIQVVLNWNNVESQNAEVEVNDGVSFGYDKGLKAMVLTSKDGFNVPVTVKVMFHIPMEKAPAVVADLGSMQDMISQVLEPRVSAHFRNAAQKMDALEIYRKRSDLSDEATAEIATMLEQHHVGTKGVMLLDVFVPDELMSPVKQAAIAIEDKKKYDNEQLAQESRKSLEAAKKEADMQEELIKSRREIEIQENNANAVAKKADGAKRAQILAAEAGAAQVKLEANANAEAITVVAEATAQQTEKVGLAEAKVVLEKGKAQAEAYKLSQEALGPDYARLQIINAIAENKMQLVPNNFVISGGGQSGASNLENLMAFNVLDKLTGRPFNSQELLQSEEGEPQQVTSKTIPAQIAETLQPENGTKKRKDQK